MLPSRSWCGQSMTPKARLTAFLVTLVLASTWTITRANRAKPRVSKRREVLREQTWPSVCLIRQGDFDGASSAHGMECESPRACRRISRVHWPFPVDVRELAQRASWYRRAEGNGARRDT